MLKLLWLKTDGKRGNILPVGGIKGKIPAARRAGIKGMKFHYVNRMEEVIELALKKKK